MLAFSGLVSSGSAPSGSASPEPARTQASTAATACGHGAAGYGTAAGHAQRASRPPGPTRTLTSVPSTVASMSGPTADSPDTWPASATACANTSWSTVARSDSSVTTMRAIGPT